MTDTDALLEAIRDDPESLDLRLVYADWLDEAGDAPRAHLIRVQCGLERLSPDHPDRPRLRREEDVLLLRHMRGWLGPLFGRLPHRHFRRGLLEAVWTTVDHFLEWADLLLRLGPLSELRLVGTARAVKRLAASPHLGRLRHLDLCCNFLTDKAAAALADSPWTGRLRELLLRGNFIGAPGAQALADSLHLDNLCRLDLSYNRLPRAARESLRDRFGDGVTF